MRNYSRKEWEIHIIEAALATQAEELIAVGDTKRIR